MQFNTQRKIIVKGLKEKKSLKAIQKEIAETPETGMKYDKLVREMVKDKKNIRWSLKKILDIIFDFGYYLQFPDLTEEIEQEMEKREERQMRRK